MVIKVGSAMTLRSPSSFKASMNGVHVIPAPVKRKIALTRWVTLPTDPVATLPRLARLPSRESPKLTPFSLI